jgi:hypothetical protein
MAEDKQSGGGFSGTNWVLLAVAAVSAAYIGLKKPPLDVLRPAAPDRAIQDDRGFQDVAARLWQDPLAAVAQSAQDEEKDSANAANQSLHSITKFREEVKISEKDKGHAPLILGVGLPGAPYAEEAESRRRSRYAVLAALNTAGYVPADEEHVGYVRVDDIAQKQFHMEWDQPGLGVSLKVTTENKTNQNCDDGRCGNMGEKEGAFRAVIPFEWFHKADPPNKAEDVVVAWIDEEILTSRSLGPPRLARLIQLLSELGISESPRIGPRFALIGPAESTTLLSLVQEALTDSEYKEQNSVLNKLSIYNSGATVSGLTFALDDRINRTNEPLPLFFSRFGINYYRTISTDDALAKALVDELKRRGVDPNRTAKSRVSSDDALVPANLHLDHIALVSEWDTIYGQLLPDSILRCFSPAPDLTAALCPPTASDQPWIHRFSYLRGLDGEVPHPVPAKAPGSGLEAGAIQAIAGSPVASATDASDNLESAFGQGQFDYLRRLADRIRATNTRLQRRGEGHIAAIGVLGSDVYDKLVILVVRR